MKVKKRTNRQEEYFLQCQITDYLRFQYPNELFISDMSGVRLPIGLAVKMKRLRKYPGIPDVFIPAARKCYHGLFIELKIKGGRLSDEQQWWFQKLNEKGYLYWICWNFDDAKIAIDSYLLCDKKTPK